MRKVLVLMDRENWAPFESNSASFNYTYTQQTTIEKERERERGAEWKENGEGQLVISLSRH